MKLVPGHPAIIGAPALGPKPRLLSAIRPAQPSPSLWEPEQTDSGAFQGAFFGHIGVCEKSALGTSG